MNSLFFCLKAEDLEHDVAMVRGAAMFKQIETLPRAERHMAVDHRNRERSVGQSRADV